MTLVLAILNTLIAIPSIAGYVESFVSAITMWGIQRSTNATLAQISDAAAASAAATTDQERYAAAQLWQNALKNPRVTLN